MAAVSTQRPTGSRSPARAVERHPPVLLPHEMEDGEVGQHAPEQRLALRVEGRAERVGDDGDERVEPQATPQLLAVQVDPKQRRPDVRHVHEQHRRHPRPARRLALQHARARPHPQRRERHQRAPQEHAHVRPRREQPRPARLPRARRPHSLYALRRHQTSPAAFVRNPPEPLTPHRPCRRPRAVLYCAAQYKRKSGPYLNFESESVMADTRCQVECEEWVRREWMSREFGQPFSPERMPLSSGGNFAFDAVSEDKTIIANISTSGARTASGKLAVGKLMKIRSDLYFLLLGRARRKVMVLCEADMYELCKVEQARGRIPLEIELCHATLPVELTERLVTARKIGSDEVSPLR